MDIAAAQNSNLILLGGPCTNSVARQLTRSPGIRHTHTPSLSLSLSTLCSASNSLQFGSTVTVRSRLVRLTTPFRAQVLPSYFCDFPEKGKMFKICAGVIFLSPWGSERLAVVLEGIDDAGFWQVCMDQTLFTRNLLLLCFSCLIVSDAVPLPEEIRYRNRRLAGGGPPLRLLGPLWRRRHGLLGQFLELLASALLHGPAIHQCMKSTKWGKK